MRGTLWSLACLMLVSTDAWATNQLIAVLPLDVSHARKKLDADAQASLEEMLRDVATDALAPAGWTILTGETTLQVLKDNGVNAEACGNQECHLASARELKADKFISGAVQLVEGEFTASVRLIDTASGRILASERVRGKTVKELTTAFEGKAKEFFQKGGLVEAPPQSETQPATPAAESAAAPAVEPVLPAVSPPPLPSVLLPPTLRAVGLEWQTRPAERVHHIVWLEGKSYCEHLPLAGGRWRLPTKDELLALFDAKAETSALKGVPGIDEDGYWTTTDVVDSNDPDRVTVVEFSGGQVVSGSRSGNTYSTRCVREVEQKRWK
jgi:hypothetical protein